MELLQKALSFHQQGNFDEAENLYLKLLSRQPKNYHALQLLGTLLISTNRQQQGIQYLKNALTINPNQGAHVSNNLALTLKQTHQYAEAISYFQLTLSYHQQDATAWAGKIECLLAIDAYNQVAEDFTELPETLHQDQKFIRLKAKYLDATHQVAGKLFLYKTLYQRNPEDSELAHNYALTLRMAGQSSEARDIYEALLQSGINDYRLFHNLANACADTNLLDKAIGYYQQAIKLNPVYAPSHKNLSNLLWQLGEKDSFLASFEQSVAKYPSNQELLFAYLETLLQVSHFKAISEMLQAKRETLQNDPRYFEISAKYHLNIGDLSQALKNQLSACSFSQVSEAMCCQLGIMYLENGDFKSAEDIFLQLLSVEPHNQSALAHLALCWRHNKDQRYQELCNYDSLVREYSLPIPENTSEQIFYSLLINELQQFHRHSQEPLDQTLLNGSQTQGHLLSYDSPQIDHIRQQVEHCINDYNECIPTVANGIKPCKDWHISGSWSVKLKQHGFHSPHYHPDGWLSVCLYLQVPSFDSDAKHAGNLFFGQPKLHGPVKHCFPADKYITPLTGKLVIFPSYFWHGTVPFNASEERITLVFDVERSKKRR